YERCGAVEAILATSHRFGRNVLILSGDAVVTRCLSTEYDVGVERIRRYVAILFGADGMKFTECDCAIVAAARDCGGAAFLLPAVHLIWKTIVSGDMVERSGRLVIPRAPRLAAVDAYRRALIDGEKQDLGMQWVDPDCMIIIAARCALDRGECCATVHRAICGGVADVDLIGVTRVGADPGEIGSATPDTLLVVYAGPALASVVGSEQAAGVAFRFDECVHAIVIAWCNGEADASEALRVGWKPARQLMPAGAAIHRLEQSAAGAVVRVARGPWRPARGPHVGIDDLRIGGIEGEIDSAGVLILIQNFRPALTTVGRAKDSALGVGAVRVAEHGGEYAVGIVRINDYGCDLLAVAESEVAPGLAGIRGFVDAIAGGEVGAAQALAGTDVDDVRIGRCEGECADGAGRLGVEDRIPGAPCVGGFPDAAVVDADVESVGLIGDSGGTDGSAAAERTDEAIAQAGVHRRIDGLGMRGEWEKGDRCRSDEGSQD